MTPMASMIVPVYNAQKTIGRCVDSILNQTYKDFELIRMKRTVFACYNDFYKDVFDEAEYEKRRIQIYRFLIEAAGDGDVAPLILPGSYRLGAERTNVSEAVQGGKYIVRKKKELMDADRRIRFVGLSIGKCIICAGIRPDIWKRGND